MTEKSPWGPIISSEEIDEDDPILKLKERINAVKNAPLDLSTGKTIKEAEDEKNSLITYLERQMVEIFYKIKKKRLVS